ncbi:MAG TPA: NifU family protein, partial [Terriglobia bacterium]|nr:NifU family protein [Terriglobia bacterium]
MEKGLRERVARIEGLVAAVRSSEMEVRGPALELVRTLMELHYAGLDRMMELVSERDGAALFERFAGDDNVSLMLLLHGLHPVDMERRVALALDTVQPYLESHGGRVELIEIREGIVRLRMVGSCNGCPSSAITVKTAIEKAI